MGRALIAVAGLLAICFVGFAGLVYFTRSEDRVAVNAALAEDLSRALALASDTPEPVEVDRYTDFEWDRLLLVAKGTPRARISHALGSEFKGDLLFAPDSKDLLVFARGSTLAGFADYRGAGRFEDVRRPIHEFTPPSAVFVVRDLVITPRR